MEYVSTKNVAHVLNAPEEWVRRMVALKIVNDNRHSRKKGRPLLFSMHEVAELYIAQHLRMIFVGLDTIYEAVDTFNYNPTADVVYYSENANESVGIYIHHQDVMITAARLWCIAYERQYRRKYTSPYASSIDAAPAGLLH
jgi:hypothetical protein